VNVEERMTLREYLAGDETMRPQELAYGILREPPAPGYGHQVTVGRVFELLVRHVRQYDAGRVVISPVDVVLDPTRALVVQPDVVFVSRERLGIVDRCIRGAPDLVVEVLSSARRRHDRTVKVEWFRKYGVRECWLVDPVSREIDVRDLTAAEGSSRVFEPGQVARSAVLPRLRLRVESVFTDSRTPRARSPEP
jgi:Uma2 family endonuclease